ncbi:MAG: DUF4382 domain-containing protein, partial [Rhodobacterales bacterium]|nr:DUF4382 domain-containing protein [Rhodobacterales bacterium]
MNLRAMTLAAAVSLLACGQPTAPSLEGASTDVEEPTVPGTSEAATGRVSIQLHDAPADDVDAVWLSVVEVTASHDQDGWVLVSDQPTTFNLLDLQGGVVQGLGLVDLPVGTYNQVRLLLSEAWVEVDGQEYDLDVPSGMQSGVKVNANFEVLECGEVVVDLDWDAGAHLTLNPQGYKLRPTINADIQYDDTGCDDEVELPGNCGIATPWSEIAGSLELIPEL